ncbi:hypothetical protein HBI56_073570 [Parastagonospora nodorum]|uniref:Uncharacterized protein n=1 Tax=Phaeosphaeria nodorum (strain SN15 / ATCC MYA-4574 / FGSC 10173) TaxID=321614 RepID=A0A7U2EXG0_PHANO|nr:hypothetical protein HBH56_171410 [Parastagonospora nodorum]QRC94522.1 hypothetical protein JI435_405970 [Parastagonospora nodorum SN15]KAH3928675.1 hypothetical protein HBH54_139970 [Parastagonospora nodorum]KAH3945496.1 hypothetical protein HBH53_145320 [Parastagonospora nodorum]KAH3983781.1 hypothetical protein HBH52_058900 [Parastagonospora nodorum]
MTQHHQRHIPSRPSASYPNFSSIIPRDYPPKPALNTPPCDFGATSRQLHPNTSITALRHTTGPLLPSGPGQFLTRRTLVCTSPRSPWLTLQRASISLGEIQRQLHMRSLVACESRGCTTFSRAKH